MNKIIVKSRRETELMPAYSRPWACISITDTDASDARMPTRNRVGLLRLKFDDVTVPMQYWTAVSTEDARRVLAFAAEVWPKADVLHVHCEAGISRSAGVAAALSRLYFGDDAKFFLPPYRPNKLVYHTILNLHQEAIAAAS
jgi:predicted protein tyrosine phosphatase